MNKNKLYFLKLEIQNHPLFEDNLEFSLVSDARVTSNTSDRLTHLLGSLWVNNLITLVGTNATGKTTIMKLLIGILQTVVMEKSIDQTKLTDVLIGNEPISVTTYFYGTDHVVYKDSLVFKLKKTLSKSWHIESETVYRKKVTVNLSKKKLFDFKNIKPELDRKELGDLASSILSSDDSIFRAIISKNKYYPQIPFDTLFFTDFNALMYGSGNVPGEILNFLDPTIEYLKIENKPEGSGATKQLFKLKFKGKDTEIAENDFTTIAKYLSSGTAKGITLYGEVINALSVGGIIFIDELENHFNHAIVDSFIEYFTNPKININRATLVFSTHYTEILDKIERTDEEYITKREGKIQLQRYSTADVRSDLNKADVFESDYLGGTAPDYDAYMALKKATEKAVKMDE